VEASFEAVCAQVKLIAEKWSKTIADRGNGLKLLDMTLKMTLKNFQ